MAMDWHAMEQDLYAQIQDRRRVGDPRVLRGRQVLLLTTIGARSGEPRTTPLVYSVDDGRIVIIASKGGSPDTSGVVHEPPQAARS